MRYIERQKEFLDDYYNKTLTLQYLTHDFAQECRKEIADYESRQTTNTYGDVAPRERHTGRAPTAEQRV